jgi:hypothetical protein
VLHFSAEWCAAWSTRSARTFPASCMSRSTWTPIPKQPDGFR